MVWRLIYYQDFTSLRIENRDSKDYLAKNLRHRVKLRNYHANFTFRNRFYMSKIGFFWAQAFREQGFLAQVHQHMLFKAKFEWAQTSLTEQLNWRFLCKQKLFDFWGQTFERKLFERKLFWAQALFSAVFWGAHALLSASFLSASFLSASFLSASF